MPSALRSAFITTNPEASMAFDYMVGAGGIATKLLPLKAIQKADTKIFQFDTQKLKPVDDEKGTNDKANKVDEGGFYTSRTLKEFKLGKDLNPRERRDADDAAKLLWSVPRAIRVITEILKLRMEARAVTLCRTAANYPTALKTSLSSGDRFDDGGSITAKRIAWNNALLDSCGKKANTIAMDQKAYDRLWLNEELQDRTKHTGAGPIPLAILKEFFEVDEILVGDLRYDSAAKGATKSISTFWGADLIAAYVNPTPNIEDVSYGHTYMLESPFKVSLKVDPEREGMAGPMETIEVMAEYLQAIGMVESSTSEKFAAGYLVQNAFTIS